MQVLVMLQKSSPGKAAGIDNISAQLLRIACEHTLRQLFYPGETSEFAHRNFIFLKPLSKLFKGSILRYPAAKR